MRGLRHWVTYNTDLLVRKALEEADDEELVAQVSEFFKPLRGLVRVLPKALDKVILRIPHYRPNQPRSNVSHAGIVATLMWRGEEDKQTGRVDN